MYEIYLNIGREEFMPTDFSLVDYTFLFSQLNKQSQLTKHKTDSYSRFLVKIFFPATFSFKYFRRNLIVYKLKRINNNKTILNTFIASERGRRLFFFFVFQSLNASYIPVQKKRSKAMCSVYVPMSSSTYIMVLARVPGHKTLLN